VIIFRFICVFSHHDPSVDSMVFMQ